MADDRTIGKRAKYTLIYWLVRVLIGLANVVPRRWWLRFCGFLGGLAYHLLPDTREKTMLHLGLAFAREKDLREIKELSKETFRMLGRNAGEILRAIRVKNLTDLEQILVTHGYENYEKANAKGKGVIFLTCHLGAFDLQVTNMSLRGLKPNIIGTPLKDARLNDLLFSYRNAYGAVAVERGRETLRLIKALKTGGTVAILIDQDTKVKSRFVDFFGMKAATPVGAAILAMKTGAAVVPTYIHLAEDGMQHMHILPELPLILTGDDEHDMVANTQVYTRFIEDTIRAYPSQWVWMHQRWKTKPGEEVR
ncbi:MAG: lysophospholipid acyltransferase family protein [Bacteroidota bacterium]